MVPSTSTLQHDQVDRWECGTCGNTRSLEVVMMVVMVVVVLLLLVLVNLLMLTQNLDGGIHGGRLGLGGERLRRQGMVMVIRSSNLR